jgi:hypothetical protein
MDANAATIIAGILGAVIGGPAGFFLERMANRARLRISYAETAYEDVYSFPVEMQQNLLRLTNFIEFVEAQVRWSLRQRLAGNLFNREELRLLLEFGQHFADLQQKRRARVENILPTLTKGGQEVEQLLPELESDYWEYYKSVLSDDLNANRDTTVRKLVDLHKLGLGRFELTGRWLNEFLKRAEEFLKQGCGTSGRVIARISIGNSGYQDAIVKTEAKLRAGDKTFRMPMQTASRPWELSETKGLSQFFVINPKSFLVLEFLLDENLNARADLEQLKQDLRRGLQVRLEAVGIGGRTAADHSFMAHLS